MCPTRDNISDNRVVAAGMNLALDGNETNAGSILDTADFDAGVSFGCLITAYTDGDHAIIIHEGDDSGLSDAAVVGAEKLIGALPSYDAIHANGDVVQMVGVHSTKRYLRASIVSTGVTTGATGSIFSLESGEVLPDADSTG